MKGVINFVLCGMALGFIALANAVAPDTLPPGLRPFNLSMLLNGTFNDTVSAFGYDPSNSYHHQATVEVWTGGGHRRPVNAGNVGGHDLHKIVSETLDRTCYSPYGKYCDNLKWQSFDTRYLKTPSAGILQSATWFRTNSAEWANDEIREILLNIVGRVLYAYTSMPLGTNCYEVPGQGRSCNIPQFIRMHLPDSSPDAPNQTNYWNVEFYGQPSRFPSHGKLQPATHAPLSTKSSICTRTNSRRSSLTGRGSYAATRASSSTGGRSAQMSLERSCVRSLLDAADCTFGESDGKISVKHAVVYDRSDPRQLKMVPSPPVSVSRRNVILHCVCFPFEG